MKIKFAALQILEIGKKLPQGMVIVQPAVTGAGSNRRARERNARVDAAKPRLGAILK